MLNLQTKKDYDTEINYFGDCFNLPDAVRVVLFLCSYVIIPADASPIGNSRTTPASHA